MLTLADLAVMVVVPKLHRQLYGTPDSDGDQADGSYVRHDPLQVGHAPRAGDERGCAPEERVLPRGIHQGLPLALLNCGAREGDVAAVLLDRQ